MTKTLRLISMDGHARSQAHDKSTLYDQDYKIKITRSQRNSCSMDSIFIQSLK
ncbi:MAG: hypothetical protein SFT93_01465 [Rickettsiaceae bacterium]|nr:hypothetical protein [Rickettsiaceae bacterium]